MMTVHDLDLGLVPRDAIGICNRLREQGKRAWIVGGCVRDLLLGRAVNDWDVCTDARPDELLRAFPRAIPTGIDHGTVTVVVNKVHYEVTTLRGEEGYSDGRRPDQVFFVDDLVRDLARRDFTVNAIALDPTTGHVEDPFDGQGDLQRKVLKAVGVAEERFSEDGLRVLRAARFVATLELELDEATARAIRPTLSTYEKVSSERIRDEWVKTMKAQRPSRAFEVMREHGLLEVTCPEMLEGVGLGQNKWHAYDVWGHAMACLDESRGDAVLRLSALFHDIGKPRTREFSDAKNDYTFYNHEQVGADMLVPILERLRFSNDERARLVHLVRHHLVCFAPDWSDAAVRRWVKKITPERLDDLYALNDADIRGKGRPVDDELENARVLKARVAEVLAAGAALSTRELKINGRDLMTELALKPGPILGKLLDALLEQVINDPGENERELLLKAARVLVEKGL